MKNSTMLVNEKNTFKWQLTSGFFILIFRRIIFQIILTTSNIFLLRMLSPEIFGSYALLSFVILNLGILTNLGLQQAFIQKNNCHPKDLYVIFSALLVTSVIFVIVIYFISPMVISFYGKGLNIESVFLLRFFSIYILFANISGLLQAQLEKKLDYKKLTIYEILTLFVTQVVTILFASWRYGVQSFIYGNLIGIVTGVFYLFYATRWMPRITFNFSALKSYLRFGLNYQFGTITGAANAAVVPGFVGKILGLSAVGYINFSGGIRQAVIGPSEIIGKMAFASVSKISSEINLLGKLIEKLIQISALTSFPLLAIVFALEPQIVSLIFGPAWIPSLTVLYISLIQGYFLVILNLSIQILLGLGKAHEVRNITIFWALLQWILTIPLVFLYGYVGAAVASLLVSGTFFIPLYFLKKEFEFRFLSNTIPFLTLSIAAGFMTYELQNLFPIHTVILLLIEVGTGLLFYLILLCICMPRLMKELFLTFQLNNPLFLRKSSR